MKQEIFKELLVRRAVAIAKERVYVDSPEEAPAGVQVQQGDQGGLWYPSEAVEGEGGDGGGGDDVEWVDTEHGKVPDTDGPIPPDMREEPIGSDSHPVLWKRPEGEEELNEYISEIQETEWYGEGSEIFERAFHGDDNTENQYTNEEGEWDDERAEKHQEWADDLLNDEAATDEDEEPIGMILLGPPGAGKGWWQEQVDEGAYGETGEFTEREFTHISSDATKEPIPEYEETNASEVHDEASKIAKENLAPKAMEDEHNVVVDKVATTPDSTLDMIETMREKGYDVRANFVNVPTEKAVHNAVSRYHEEGRFTPLDFVNGADEDSRESFNTILDEAGIPDSKAGRFNNDVEWGNPPEAEFIGEDLLKVVREILRGYKYDDDERQHGEQNDGTSRSRRDRRRDSGVDGGRLRRSGGGRDEGSDGRERERVALEDLVKEVEEVFPQDFSDKGDDTEKFVRAARDVLKGRVYVDSPEDAPEGVNVQEGEGGGTYYVPGGGNGENVGAGSDVAENIRDSIRAGIESDIDNPLQDGLEPIGDKPPDDWPVHEDTNPESYAWVPVENLDTTQEEIDLGTVAHKLEQMRNDEPLSPAVWNRESSLEEPTIQDGNHTVVAGWLAGYDRVPVEIPIKERYDATDDPDDWLYSKHAVVDGAVKKLVSWLPLASESPEPERERVDAPWNEVEGDEDLPVKEKARQFVNEIAGDAEVDGDRLEFTPPFTKDEAEYMEQGDSDFDETHENCRSCAFYVEGGGCLMVQGEIDEDDYCTQLFSDVAIAGHAHEDEEQVAEEVTIWGDEYNWDDELTQEFADSVQEILSEKQGQSENPTEQLADKFLKRLVEKNRVYIDDPSEAPQGALVRQGRSGRWYYNTRQTQERSPTRVYISSPEEAPDGCNVRGGSSGGYYYYDHEHPRGQR